MLLGGGERLFHVPGIAVNRARDAYPQGEAKSDSKDAHVIADQLRLRRGSLHEVRPRDEATTQMRLLVAHRRDLLQDQTRRAARLREVLLGVFPGLGAALDLRVGGRDEGGHALGRLFGRRCPLPCSEPRALRATDEGPGAATRQTYTEHPSLAA